MSFLRKLVAMKTNNPLGLVAPGVMTQHLQQRLPSNDPGSVIYQGPPINLTCSSPNYVAMNAVINMLDMTYKSLPPGPPAPPPTKTPWIDLSPSYGASSVCGCANSPMTGQKLFRAYNYPRAVQHQPLILAPPSAPAINFYSVTGISIIPILAPPFFTVTIATAAGLDPFLIIWQFGRGLSNPISMTPPNPGVYVMPPSDPAWSSLSALHSPGRLKWCSWDIAGMPAGTGAAPY